MPARLHPHHIIRHAVRDTLLGRTAAGSRVHAMRMVPFRATEMPALAVYCLGEDIDPESRTESPRWLTRTVNIVIEAAVSAGANTATADDQLDAIALQIEDAMHADDQLGAPDTIDTSILAGSENDVIGEGDRYYGVRRLLYAVTCYTPAPDPNFTPVADDFSTADIRYNQRGEQDEADEAHDVLTDLEE